MRLDQLSLVLYIQLSYNHLTAPSLCFCFSCCSCCCLMVLLLLDADRRRFVRSFACFVNFVCQPTYSSSRFWLWPLLLLSVVFWESQEYEKITYVSTLLVAVLSWPTTGQSTKNHRRCESLTWCRKKPVHPATLNAVFSLGFIHRYVLYVQRLRFDF